MVFLEVDAEDAPAVRAAFPEAVIEAGALAGDALRERCRDAEVVCSFIHTKFPAETLAALPKLKLLCTRSVGVDHIDTAWCAAHDVTVCNVPDYGSHVIAEHVFALLLSALRHIPEGDRRVEEGTFDYHGLRGMALKGKTLGIVGTGKIGRAVARIAHGFDMKILAVDQCRTVELTERYGVAYVDLPALLAGSDVVTLHLPATPATRHLFNAAAFARMKRGAVLVNTARGTLIDTSALLQALGDGTVALALLDVLEHEENVKESAALVRHPHVVTTPHIAFYADDSMRSMYDDAFASIGQWRRGERPAHAVEPLRVVCDLPPARSA